MGAEARSAPEGSTHWAGRSASTTRARNRGATSPCKAVSGEEWVGRCPPPLLREALLLLAPLRGLTRQSIHPPIPQPAHAPTRPHKPAPILSQARAPARVQLRLPLLKPEPAPSCHLLPLLLRVYRPAHPAGPPPISPPTPPPPRLLVDRQLTTP